MARIDVLEPPSSAMVDMDVFAPAGYVGRDRYSSQFKNNYCTQKCAAVPRRARI